MFLLRAVLGLSRSTIHPIAIATDNLAAPASPRPHPYWLYLGYSPNYDPDLTANRFQQASFASSVCPSPHMPRQRMVSRSLIAQVRYQNDK